MRTIAAVLLSLMLGLPVFVAVYAWSGVVLGEAGERWQGPAEAAIGGGASVLLAVVPAALTGGLLGALLPRPPRLVRDALLKAALAGAAAWLAFLFLPVAVAFGGGPRELVATAGRMVLGGALGAVLVALLVWAWTAAGPRAATDDQP